MHRDDRYTPEAAPRQAVPFDYQRSLARLGGDPQLFAEIAALFLEDSPKLLERARVALRRRELAGVELAAHSLKGLCVNFDAEAMARAAAVVEQHAQERDQERAEVCFEELEQELSRLQRALAEWQAAGGGR
jgi:HPt (histidine-containing phosphotransfer) domain-containing protein